MDEEIVNKQLENLRITAEEKTKVVAIVDDDLNEADEDLQGSSFCKILSSKLINSEIFKSMIARIWNVEGRIRIKTVGKNIEHIPM